MTDFIHDAEVNKAYIAVTDVISSANETTVDGENVVIVPVQEFSRLTASYEVIKSALYAYVLSTKPNARRVYGVHNGKQLTSHPESVDCAIEAFLKFKGAIFVDGKPIEKFGISTASMSTAIQAYLDYYRQGVGETNG